LAGGGAGAEGRLNFSMIEELAASAHELHDSDEVDLVGAVEGAVQLGGGLLPIRLYISGEFIYVQLPGSQYSSSTLL
jgi:hypothetical protein